MKEHDFMINKFIKRIFVLCFILLLFSPLILKQTANAENIINISTGDYVSGEWTNKSVVIEAEIAQVEGAKLSYSLNNGLTYQTYKNPLNFEEDTQTFLEFKAEISSQIYYESISINIDKTPAVIERIEISELEYTSKPVTIFVVLEDSSNQKELYTALFLGKELISPNQEALSLGLIMFSYTVNQNTVFDIGDIEIFDQAGNKTINDKKINILNIDKSEPEFNLTLLKKNLSYEEKIKLELGYVASGTKQIFVETPSGKIIKLDLQQEQIFTARKEGMYIFTVISNAGYQQSKAIFIKGLNLSSMMFSMAIILFAGGIFITLFVFRKSILKNAFKKKN
jgi:hypothetical protein